MNSLKIEFVRATYSYLYVLTRNPQTTKCTDGLVAMSGGELTGRTLTMFARSPASLGGGIRHTKHLLPFRSRHCKPSTFCDMLCANEGAKRRKGILVLRSIP